jgi:integrase
MREPIRDRSGIYHYRRRVPDDVRRALQKLDMNSGASAHRQDKREEKKRLGRDLALAQLAWEEHDRAVEARWATLRRGQPNDLSPVHVQALAGDIHRRWLKIYHPKNPDTGSDAGYWLRVMQEIDGEVPREETASGSDEDRLEYLHGDHVDAVLYARGLIVDGRARYRLILAAQDSAKHACRVAIRKFHCTLGDDPDEAIVYPKWPDPTFETLSGLCSFWIAQTAHVKPESHASFKASVNKFIAFIGHDEVSKMSAADVENWIAHLKELKLLSERKLGDLRIKDGYFAALRAVFNMARKKRKIQESPCDGIVPDKKPLVRKREKDLRDSEIYAILKASLALQNDVSDDVANTRRWVPWLLAYTGARVAEITRLESKHIIKEAGVWGIDIQQSKNGRPRIVPIHRHLIEDKEFLKFLDSRKGGPLFFDPKYLTKAPLVIHKTRAEGLAEWARKAAGIEKGTVKPNHGWRHRFKTECRRIAMDREVRLYIQGHAFKLEGEKYGFFPIDITASWMELFPIYDVSGEDLHVERPRGNDVVERAIALLRWERTASSKAHEALANA